MNKQEFLQHVDEYTDQDESVLGDLLNIVTTKFNRMVQHEKNRRDSAHFKAARDGLDQVWADRVNVKNPKLFDKTTCACLLDAMSEVYPTCEGGCDAGDQLLKHYSKSVRELGWEPDDCFIKDIRGKSEWLELLYKIY